MNEHGFIFTALDYSYYLAECSFESNTDVRVGIQQIMPPPASSH